ncbi:Methyltransferase [Quillaja saponaria]|uniref:Methyltransferase n=1 Tax=Quillaja saponaria TaxID=32244 RepID=A0AAD7LKL7_QUISA|nr:Methyltransferase [Quillaja saponaria]
MEPPTLKPNLLRNILIRLLSFGVLVFAVRFAYIVTVKGGSCDSGDFCFFPENLNIRGASVRVQSVSAVSDVGHLSTTKKWRGSVDYYSSIFQDLISEGSLSPNSIALCIETQTGEDVLALKEMGIVDSVGIFKKAYPPLIVHGEAHSQPFGADTFDFEFSGNGGLDRSARPAEFAAEINRTLKPGGFLVIHTSAAKDMYSFNSLLELFNFCILIRSHEIDGVDSSSIREVVMKKHVEILGFEARESSLSGNSANKCSVPGYKREIIRNAEPLILEEPLKPWITLKRNIKNVKYLTSVVDISYKNRYVYVDVGARSYGSSIASWFKKQYPKQNKTFDVYAIEADRAFHEEYKRKKRVKLLPYAAWVRNETLFFEITRDPGKKVMPKGGGMGRIHPVKTSSSYMGHSDTNKIEGFDLADWLKSTVTYRDFVVMKMDVEGTEFHLIPRLIQTGAICLIDEFFFECHYNRWQRCCPGQRSAKYQKTYAQCLDLFTSLRESGVLVHQWW